MKYFLYILPAKTRLFATLIALGFGLLALVPSRSAAACNFLVPDANGNAVQGPSFGAMHDGFIRGLLECGAGTYNLMIMTINVDTTQKHVGVRDDSLFGSDVTGELKTISNVPVSTTSNIYVLDRVNQSPFIGVRRGFVRFATLCDAKDAMAPLNCSWGTSRIKFRATTLDTDADEVVDRSYHELSIYNADGRLHMVTFWTPNRDQIINMTEDWISALKAFGLDVLKAG